MGVFVLKGITVAVAEAVAQAAGHTVTAASFQKISDDALTGLLADSPHKRGGSRTCRRATAAALYATAA